MLLAAAVGASPFFLSTPHSPAGLLLRPSPAHLVATDTAVRLWHAPASLPAASLSPDGAEVVTPAERQQWERVSQCETRGDWGMQGPLYSGGLGIRNTTWSEYGGREFAPDAGLATVDQQIVVARRIQPTVPDQSGCTGAW
jgi:hypothetical protein